MSLKKNPIVRHVLDLNHRIRTDCGQVDSNRSDAKCSRGKLYRQQAHEKD
jgi:hypothetical protein